MVENIKKVSERATMTEIQKICMLGSARILRKVVSVWTEWLTWVTGALGAWFAPGWCTKRTPAKTVIIETIIIIDVGLSHAYQQQGPDLHHWPYSHWRRTMDGLWRVILWIVRVHPRSTQGQSVGSGEKAGRAKEPLGTDSHRTISKNSSRCRLLTGHKMCFVLLCPIGEQFLLSSFREFVHDGYCLDHGLSGSCTKNIHAVRKLSVWY